MKDWLETLVILVIVSSALLAVVGKKSFAGPMRLVCALAVACAALALPLNFALNERTNLPESFINFDYGNKNGMETARSGPAGEDLVEYAARRMLEARVGDILEAALGQKLEVEVTGEKSIRVRLAGGVGESEVRLALSALGAGWEITAEE